MKTGRLAIAMVDETTPTSEGRFAHDSNARAQAQRRARMAAFIAKAWPLALVFLTSANVMVIELVAGRLIARHVGSSLYTWTSVIAVVLAGVAVGNYVGGWLSDRCDERRARSTLSVLLFVSAASSLAILWVHWWAFGLAATLDLNWPLRILIGVMITFFVPSVTLGAISPLVASIALRRTAHIGGTVGGLYAWGSIGAIAGTLATGFVLIPTFGTSLIVFSVAVILGLLGLLVAPSMRSVTAMGVLLGIALSTAPLPAFGLPSVSPREITDRPGLVFSHESPYQTIAVTRDSSGRLTMLQDDLVHGYFDPDFPEYLEYPYLRLVAGTVDSLSHHNGPIEALLLGGGAYTFPRYLVTRNAASKVVVSEIDEAVTRASEAAMHFDRNAGVDVIHTDARIAVADLARAGGQFDLVFSDAFRDVGVPHHLTTREFVQLVATVVRADGLFVANAIDVYADGRFLGAYVNTVRTVFEDVVVLATSRPTTDHIRNTFVVVASERLIDRDTLLAAARRHLRAAYLLDETEIAHLYERSEALVLSDDYAPVDSLISIIPHLR